MQEKICREKFYNFFIFDFIKCYNSKSGKRNQEIIPFASVSRQRKEEFTRMLISPMSSKYALTQNAPYSDLFREFVNCLAQPNSVLFTSGFSYGDSHISNLIEDALGRTDFTLYAFVSNPFTSENAALLDFYKKVSNAPNAYFIYPDCQDSSPLKFEDFAYFMQPYDENYGDSIRDERDSCSHLCRCRIVL